MRENGKKILFAPRSNTSSVLSDPSEFIGIALSGDIEKFRDYISVYPDIVNVKEKDNGNVALHIASSKGNVQMASLLLSKGANLNIQDIFGNSPLHYAVDKRRKDMAELLIKCGADVNMKDFRGNTPLHAACVNNDIDLVRLLLLHNANPESSDLSDVKPMQKATDSAVKALIERKIQLLKGGDEDQQAKIVTMMSFGIGLGECTSINVTILQEHLPHVCSVILRRGGPWDGNGQTAAVSLRTAHANAASGGAKCEQEEARPRGGVCGLVHLHTARIRRLPLARHQFTQAAAERRGPRDAQRWSSSAAAALGTEVVVNILASFAHYVDIVLLNTCIWTHPVLYMIDNAR